MKRKTFTALRFVENRFSLLFAVYVVSFLLCFSLSAFMPHREEGRYALLLALLLIAFYLPLLFLLRSEEGRNAPLGMNRIKKVFLPEAGMLAAAAFALGTGGALLYQGISFPLPVYGMAIFPEKFSLFSFFALVLVSAFCEEILVRGALQTHFATLGSFLAVAVSACLSAALCFSLSALPLFLLAGLLCAIARSRTESVFSALTCAVLFRLGIYLVALSLWRAPAEAIGTVALSLVFLSVFLLLAVGAFFTGKGKHKRRERAERDSGRQRLALVLLAACALALSTGASFLIPIM